MFGSLIVQEMLSDANPMVVANALAALQVGGVSPCMAFGRHAGFTEYDREPIRKGTVGDRALPIRTSQLTSSCPLQFELTTGVRTSYMMRVIWKCKALTLRQ